MAPPFVSKYYGESVKSNDGELLRGFTEGDDPAKVYIQDLTIFVK